MAKTDNPLKIHFTEFLELLTPWLMGQPIQSVKESNIELPATELRTDQIFEVVMANGEEIVLHVEFEAGKDTEVMKWRVLNYMSRITYIKRKSVQSVVVYIGNIGKSDSGKHSIGNQSWNYKVIRLADIKASEILATNNPALISLIGLTKLARPEQEVFEALDKIKETADNEDKKDLLGTLLILLPSERLVDMVQEQLEKEDWLLNTPFLQKIRGQGREEGREEEREELAKKLKEDGMPIEKIAKLTNIDIKEIESW